MMDTNTTNSSRSNVVGYFSSRSDAERAVNELKERGFTSSQIGITTRSSHAATAGTDKPYIGDRKAANSTGPIRGTTETTGEKVRGAWDKIVDFFGGEDRERIDDRADESYANRSHPGSYEAQSSAVPASVRPDADSLATGRPSEYSATVAQGNSRSYDYDYEGEEFEGSLQELQVPQERSRYFRHLFDRNPDSTIVTVSAPGRENEAEAILERNGADLGANAANYTYPSTEGDQENYPQRIQLLGEALRVHKQRTSRGDVRVHKQVVSDVQTLQVPVTREELVIERSEGTTIPIDAKVGGGGEIRVPLSEETVTVEKQPYVREEVSIGKRTVSDVQQFEERVRREELKVDDERKNRTA